MGEEEFGELFVFGGVAHGVGLGLLGKSDHIFAKGQFSRIITGNNGEKLEGLSLFYMLGDEFLSVGVKHAAGFVEEEDLRGEKGSGGQPGALLLAGREIAVESVAERSDAKGAQPGADAGMKLGLSEAKAAQVGDKLQVFKKGKVGVKAHIGCGGRHHVV